METNNSKSLEDKDIPINVRFETQRKTLKTKMAGGIGHSKKPGSKVTATCKKKPAKTPCWKTGLELSIKTPLDLGHDSHRHRTLLTGAFTEKWFEAFRTGYFIANK